MLKERQAVAIPVQEHGQILIDIWLCKLFRKLLEIQYRLRNLKAVRENSTIRVLSQAEFLSENRNAITISWSGLNRLVQMIFVHDSFAVQGLLTGGLGNSRYLLAHRWKNGEIEKLLYSGKTAAWLQFFHRSEN